MVPTFFTLQGHSGLQVVHLELQTFQGAVCVSGLPFVGYQHSNDDQQQQAASPSDANDGRKSQQAVGVDLKSPWRVLEATSTDLNTQTVENKKTFTPTIIKKLLNETYFQASDWQLLAQINMYLFHRSFERRKKK